LNGDAEDETRAESESAYDCSGSVDGMQSSASSDKHFLSLAMNPGCWRFDHNEAGHEDFSLKDAIATSPAMSPAKSQASTHDASEEDDGGASSSAEDSNSERTASVTGDNITERLLFYLSPTSDAVGFVKKPGFHDITHPAASMAKDAARPVGFCLTPAKQRADLTIGKKTLFGPSKNAYRRVEAGAALSRNEELKRCVCSLLNKVCPENVSTIASRIKREASVETVQELAIVIGLIFRKALDEPHYCGTYADLVYHLKTQMPAFPAEDGGKPVTFKSTLLDVCQNEFEAMPRVATVKALPGKDDDSAEVEFQRTHAKARFLANMKFIGNLFLRHLLKASIVAEILGELMLGDGFTGAEGGKEILVPEEPVVECVCELLVAIGFSLEETAAGKSFVTMVCGRLLDLKQQRQSDGKGIYSKRIQFAIQDVLDARTAGWTRKVFKAAAKTKEEVRRELERSFQAPPNKRDASGAEFVVAGQRPACVESCSAGASAVA